MWYYSDADIQQMRERIKQEYPNDCWAAKVEAMPDKQIVGIYRRILTDGCLNKAAFAKQQRLNEKVMTEPKEDKAVPPPETVKLLFEQIARNGELSQENERLKEHIEYLESQLQFERKRARHMAKLVAPTPIPIPPTHNPCDRCAVNPKNGGSGHCNCTIGGGTTTC